MDVLDFINSFTDKSKNDQVIDVFSGKHSYWFASILYKRFIKDQAIIMFDVRAECFGTKIGNRIYDIHGDVTNSHKWVLWKNISDGLKNKIKTEHDLL